MIILLTGAAGFIGFHAARRLLSEGHRVLGVDNLNDYYDVSLKQARLAELQKHDRFEFYKIDISDHAALGAAIEGKGITHILHLAAQAGVRYSLDNPRAYVQANVLGHLNILEFARHSGTVEHIAYASSSSVYGDREDGPFREADKVRSPASLYAATKLGGEMLAESYQRLYGIPQTGLRFFTVYGPWGRPDMAYFIFTDKILKGQPIELFAPDEMRRDFTYVDDIVEVLPKILKTPPQSGHEIYNLGNSKPNTLMQLVEAVEAACGTEAEKIILGKQKGDVSNTFADVSAAERDFGFKPKMGLGEGIGWFVEWYNDFKGDDLFGIVYGTGPDIDVEAFKKFEWSEIVAQINEGKSNAKMTWVLNTYEIPEEYDAEKLKKKYLKNYGEHLKMLIESTAKS